MDATGSEIVLEKLRKIERQTGSMRPVFGKIADLLKKSHEVNFEGHGTRFGHKWAGRKRAYSWPILQKTGALSKSFRSSYDDKSATVKNTASYAKYHQLGTKRMVSRPIVGWADKDLNEVVRIIRKNTLEA